MKSFHSRNESAIIRRMGLLSDRKILIAGLRNRRSLAHAVSVSCAREGARLAFAVQPGGKALEKAEGIVRGDFGGDAPIVSCDAGKDSDIAETIRAAAKHFGGEIDGVVHAIAFAQMDSLRGAYHENASRESFCEALDISAYTFTAFLREAQKQGALSGDASAVTLTYLGGERAMPNYNLMGVAKAALESSVRYLALGLGGGGVRVNAVSAGPVKTLAAAAIGDFGRILRQVENQAPLRRNIGADEVGDAAAFLLSPLSRGITGEILHVDAGYHATAAGRLDGEGSGGGSDSADSDSDSNSDAKGGGGGG